jgi:outer membrane autotransporter protein
VGPIAALQYTEVNIDGFSEKGSLAPMAIHEGSAQSLRSDIGFRGFYQWQIGKVVVEPSLKATWEHEYNTLRCRSPLVLPACPDLQGPSLGRVKAMIVLW